MYDFVLRVKPRHDILGAKTMFKRFKHRNVLILGDRGYDSEQLHELVVESVNKFYAPVRDFKVRRPKGYHRRRCVQGLEQSGQRSIVESTIRSLKVRIRHLRSKLHHMKKREMAWAIIVYNLLRINERFRILFRILIAYSG